MHFIFNSKCGLEVVWKKCNEHTGCLDCSECLDQYSIILLLQMMSQVIFLPSLSFCTANGEEAGKRDSVNPGWGSVTSSQAKEAQRCTDSPAGRELGWLYQPQHRVKSLKSTNISTNTVLTKSHQEFVEATEGYGPELQKIKLGADFVDATLDLFFTRRLFHCM